MRVSTTYRGATDTRGACIVVRFDGRRRTVSYNYSADVVTGAHESAVRDALAHAGLEVSEIALTGGTNRGFRFLVATAGGAA